MDYAYRSYEDYAKKCPLKAGMDLDAARLEVNRFWDKTMLYVTQEMANQQARNVYSLLIRQAKAQTDTLYWLEEPEVFYSTAAANRGKRRTPWFGLSAALLLLALVIWFAVPHKERNILYAGVAGAALVLWLIKFVILFAAVAAKPTVHIRTEQRLSPEKVCAGLMRMTREIDGSADTLMAMLSENLPDSDHTDMSLARELIRLPRELSTDEVRTAVDQFLVRNQVEKILYTPDRQDMFMVLPADREMTIEPALVKNGKVLSMGVACTPGEG